MICKEDNLSLKELLCLNPLCFSKRTGGILSTSQQMWNLPGQDQGRQPVPALAWSCFQAQEGLGQLLVPFSGRPPARGHSQRTLASPPVPKGLFLCLGRCWQLQAVPCPATGTRLSPSLSGHTATKPGPSDSSHVSTSCSDQKKRLRGDPFSQLPACLCEELQLRLSSVCTPAGRRGTRAVRRSFAFVFHGQQLRLPRPRSHRPSC